MNENNSVSVSNPTPVLESEKISTSPQLKSIVAITACAAGIAHTYMAADALKKEAEKMNIAIHVETQGTIGAENVIPNETLLNADLVIIAADVKIDVSRFNGKKIYSTGVNEAIKDSKLLIETAWEQGNIQGKKGTKVGSFTIGATKKKGPLAHMMTGISWILPLTIAGGLIMAFANLMAFQTEYLDSLGDYNQNWVLYTRPLPQFMMDIGGLSFRLMIPLFAAFIAYSISDRPGIAPALIGGWIINDNKMLGVEVPVSPNSVIEPGAGFLGAIIIGFLSGYLVQLLKVLHWPKFLKPIVPLMIIPVIAVFSIATFTKFVIGKPIATLVIGLFDGLTVLQTKFAGTSIIIALVVSIMVAFDLGGPFNKTALVFGTVVFYQSLAMAMANGGSYWDANFVPGTATQAAISVPPLGMWLSTMIFKTKFTKNERVMGNAAFGQGIMGITEGAIPFAATDPLRVIFANVVGAAVAGVGVTLTGAKFAAGIGSPIGTFLGYIQQSGPLGWPMSWILPIVLGILTTALIAGFTKKKLVGEELEIVLEEKKIAKEKRKQVWANTKLMFKKPKIVFVKIGRWFGKRFKNYLVDTKKYYTWAWKNIVKYFKDKWIGIKTSWGRFTLMFKKIFRKRKQNKTETEVLESVTNE